MKKMSCEERLLLACTRQNLLEQHQQAVLDICQQVPIKWDIVYETARQHNVAPLIYTNLLRCPIPKPGLPSDIKAKFEQSYYRNIAIMSGLSKKIAEKLAFFNAQSIDVMLIKGAALAILVYDQPWYTIHDVDLVIKLHETDLSPSNINEINTLFDDLPGVEYDFFEHHDVVLNGMLPVDFCQIWAQAKKIAFGGQEVFVMSPEDMLISVCINSCRKRFFKLKSLFDIAEIIEKYPDLNWDELITKAKAYQCHNIAYTALWTTNLTVGCKLPEGVLDAFAVNPVRAAVVRRVSRSISFSRLSSLYSGIAFYGVPLSTSLLLPYVTYSPVQLWRKFVLRDQFWKPEEARQ